MSKYTVSIQKGQTLIEVLVAIAVSALLLLGVTSLTLTILKNSTTNDDQSQALSYAQSGLEFLRNAYNTDPAGFYGTGSYCLSSTEGVTGYPSSSCSSSVANLQDSNGDTVFLRTFQVSAGSDCPTPAPPSTYSDIQVNVSVAWTDSKCLGGSFCHASQLETCLSNASNF